VLTVRLAPVILALLCIVRPIHVFSGRGQKQFRTLRLSHIEPRGAPKDHRQKQQLRAFSAAAPRLTKWVFIGDRRTGGWRGPDSRIVQD